VSNDSRFIALHCRLSPGMFSSERAFRVQLANNDTHNSVTPQHYCWNNEGRLLADAEPTGEIDGLIAARLVDQLSDGQCIVEVPDGEVLAVEPALVVWQRPTEIRPPSPIGKKERTPHVPV
jgi:hypothetical protein